MENITKEIKTCSRKEESISSTESTGINVVEVELFARNIDKHDGCTFEENTNKDNVNDIEESIITYEHTTCLDSLSYIYTPYFTDPLTVIIHKSSTYLKRLFLIICLGRETSCTYPCLDKFYTETCLRSWVCLNKR